MPDQKISDLTAATSVEATDHFVIARASNNLKVPGSLITSSSNLHNVSQAAHGFAVGDVVRLSGSTYTKAKADSETNAEVVGIISTIVDTDNFKMTASGRIINLSSLTAGAVYYLSPTTAGALTTTEPSTVGQISKPLLVADTTTSGFLFNMRGAVIGSVSSLLTTGWASANETWTYGSADDPTYTFTVAGDKTSKYSAGMKVRVTQSSTLKYFIITKVEHAAGTTTVTLYGGTDYDLANATISDPCYSMVKSPFGFPLDPEKWTVETTSSSGATQASPTSGTWYNLGSLSISVPIGSWIVSYQVNLGAERTSGNASVDATLSTANNSESDDKWTSRVRGDADTFAMVSVMRSRTVTVTSKTSYYLNAAAADSGMTTIYFSGVVGATVIRAVCAYL